MNRKEKKNESNFSYKLKSAYVSQLFKKLDERTSIKVEVYKLMST